MNLQDIAKSKDAFSVTMVTIIIFVNDVTLFKNEELFLLFEIMKQPVKFSPIRLGQE